MYDAPWPAHNCQLVLVLLYSRILKSVILIFLSKQKSMKKTKYLPRMQETSDFLFLLPMVIQKMNAFLDKKPTDKKLF